MSELVTVKAKRKDGRVAFFEKDDAHPKGQAFVYGNGKAVEVERTAAVEEALGDGRLVLSQASPTTQQTPATRSGPGAMTQPANPPASREPWEGYDKLSATDILDALEESDEETRDKVLAYERAKGDRGRKTIIDKLVNWAS